MRTSAKPLVPDFARENYLRQIMSERGLTQHQVAMYAGIPDSTLTALLNRGISGAATDTVARVCDALDIDFTHFVHGKFRIASFAPTNSFSLRKHTR